MAGIEVIGNTKVAKIWKNGVATSLSDGTKDASAYSVFVSGSDVYVAGKEEAGSITIAKLWKNGVATSLSTANSGALGVFVKSQ
ncbi:MAG: hypothetical protein H0W75_02340 [Chitinophagaceae bacterium]|nr:hypothetical protein [Chitinophagaceae bacterium]